MALEVRIWTLNGTSVFPNQASHAFGSEIIIACDKIRFHVISIRERGAFQYFRHFCLRFGRLINDSQEFYNTQRGNSNNNNNNNNRSGNK